MEVIQGMLADESDLSAIVLSVRPKVAIMIDTQRSHCLTTAFVVNLKV